jgi:pimeloyl-ACP methyl ester carboxylesterase
LVVTAASLIARTGRAQVKTKARNIVLVHGLFADGSCWSEVIARLQAVGLNATGVQNPLTTLPEAVASAQRALARQDGPTALVGHSFSGMIVTEARVHPNVSALVYVAVSCFLRQAVKVDSAMKRVIHHEDAETVFG